MIGTFVSIDIETLGLDPDMCDVIEVGAVVDNWLSPIVSPPTFHCYIKQDEYHGQPYAMSMHPKILRRIATEEEGYTYLTREGFAHRFNQWLSANTEHRKSSIVIAGKNFAHFDARFLRRLPGFTDNINYSHRILDPGMLFWNPLEDTKVPNLKTCMERAGIEDEVTHTALEDAKVVAKLIQIAAGRIRFLTELLQDSPPA